jgi:hypothetical protein
MGSLPRDGALGAIGSCGAGPDRVYPDDFSVAFAIVPGDTLRRRKHSPGVLPTLLRCMESEARSSSWSVAAAVRGEQRDRRPYGCCSGASQIQASG